MIMFRQGSGLLPIYYVVLTPPWPIRFAETLAPKLTSQHLCIDFLTGNPAIGQSLSCALDVLFDILDANTAQKQRSRVNC